MRPGRGRDPCEQKEGSRSSQAIYKKHPNVQRPSSPLAALFRRAQAISRSAEPAAPHKAAAAPAARPRGARALPAITDPMAASLPTPRGPVTMLCTMNMLGDSYNPFEFMALDDADFSRVLDGFEAAAARPRSGTRRLSPRPLEPAVRGRVAAPPRPPRGYFADRRTESAEAAASNGARSGRAGQGVAGQGSPRPGRRRG